MFSMPDMAVILVIALIIFGPSKLPDIGKSLGRGIRDFKKAVDGNEPSDRMEKLEASLPSSEAPANVPEKRQD
jgi:sec-independent protein translocase protein TatA